MRRGLNGPFSRFLQIWLCVLAACGLAEASAPGEGGLVGGEPLVICSDGFAWEMAASKRAIESMLPTIEAPRWNFVEDFGDVLSPTSEQSLAARFGEVAERAGWKLHYVTCRQNDMLLQTVKARLVAAKESGKPVVALVAHASGLHLALVLDARARDFLGEPELKAWIADTLQLGRREAEQETRFQAVGKAFLKLLEKMGAGGGEATPVIKETPTLAYAGLKQEQKRASPAENRAGKNAGQKSSDPLEPVAYWLAAVLAAGALAGIGLRIVLARRHKAMGLGKPKSQHPAHKLIQRRIRGKGSVEPVEGKPETPRQVAVRPRSAVPPVSAGLKKAQAEGVLARLRENAAMLSVVPGRVRGAIVESMLRQLDKYERYAVDGRGETTPDAAGSIPPGKEAVKGAEAGQDDPGL